MECPECGKNIDENSSFCPFCGKKLENKVCQKCLTAYNNSYEFCPKCGLKICTQEEFNNILNLQSKVQELYNEKKYSEAIEILKIQLEYLPNPEPVLYLLGVCYFFLDDYDNSNEYLDKLMEVNPEYKGLWLKKAHIASKQKDYDKAEEYCLKEIELHQDKDAYLHLISCYDTKGEYEKMDNALEDLSNTEGAKEYLLQVYNILDQSGDNLSEKDKLFKEKIKKKIF
ncbi:zinc ribbon domain-containing protein [uncultured Methanobrevibacter sp.]|uniref:double zinc ribbon domain-containing protein n=1 Tax=uncultured Methanobrevibacter sp. TaxID=253161 RepID=UPI0026249D84